MTTRFARHELPFAYTMIAAAQRIRPRRDGSHLFQGYFFYWAAFTSIYTAIARGKGHTTRLVRNDDGSIATVPNGSVSIPKVESVSERQQIDLAFQDLDEDVKHTLIVHPSTKFFARRVPAWQGGRIEHDAFGQRVNGVIQVYNTSDPQYPVWSPIDHAYYEAYLKTTSEGHRNLLARQVLDLLCTVRENWMHASRARLDDANDLTVVENALPLLQHILEAFTR